MEKESKLGVMEPSTMATGEMEWPKGRVLFIMLMAMFTPVSSIKTEQMDSVFMFILTDRDMKDFGKMTIKMDLEKKNSKTGQNMMGPLRVAKNGVKEHINGLMRASI